MSKRVRLTRNVGDYPIRPILAGSTGVLITTDYGIAVVLDVHHPDLDEWDNVLFLEEWLGDDAHNAYEEI
jgi:hypothetical protein